MKMKVLHNLCLLPLLLVFSCRQQQEAVIPFEHALPAQNIDGRQNGTYNNIELAIPGVQIKKKASPGRRGSCPKPELLYRWLSVLIANSSVNSKLYEY